jgi:uncharacterized membrane protein YfcA
MAATGAGAVNAIAGGGTLISFPTLLALGVPAVSANVTNTVSLLPGYLSGAWTQREDLRPQLAQARTLSVVAAVGGLAGSVLLLLIPSQAFRDAVPYLILVSCLLLSLQEPLRRRIGHPVAGSRRHSIALASSCFAAAVYGGFFGAGLGIVLLAVLGLFSSEPLAKVNALKQALSLLINLVAAVFFVFSGRVVWSLIPFMAIGALVGGWFGAHGVQLISERVLRRVVVAAGVVVAAVLLAA